MIKLLFISNSLAPGGSETQMMLLINHLILTNKYRIDLLILDKIDENFVNKEKTLKLVNIIHDNSFQKCNNKFQFISAYIHFIRLFRKKKYDLIIPYHRNTSMVFSFISLFVKAKCIYQNRGGNLFLFKKPGIITRILIKLARPIFISNSYHGRKQLVQLLRIDHEDINVIHNSAPEYKTTKYTKQQIKQFYDIKDKTIIITYIANFFPEKNHKTIIRAWHNFIKNNPESNAKLYLVGKEDTKSSCYTESKSLIVSKKLSDTIIIYSDIINPTNILSVTDIGIFCSESEGLPNVILEYLSFKIPIIASDIEGVKEIIGSHYNFYFPPKDITTLEKLIADMVADKNRNAIGIELEQRCLQNFSYKEMVTKFENLIIKST